MKGSPLRRAVIAFLLILGLVGYPLWRTTREAEAAGAAAPETAVAVREVQLEITSTATPESITLWHLGKVIWKQEAPGARFEQKLQIPFPREGVDLRFQIEWPAAVEFAGMRVRLTDPEGNEHEKSLWGRGSVEEVLTFP